MKFRLLTDIQACHPHRDKWNKLAMRASDDISQTYEWHLALCKSHLNQKTAPVVWVEDDNELVGMFPFYLSRRVVRGVPLVFIEPITQLYSNHESLLLKEHSLVTIGQVLDFLQAEGYRWHAFAFLVSQESPLYTQCAFEAMRSNVNLEFSPAHRSPYLTLDGGSEDLLREKSAKFRNDIRTRTRRLEEKGRLELLTHSGIMAVGDIIEYVRDIEKQSWKERSKSSITSHAAQESFYAAFTPLALEQNWLRFYVLLLDGKPIAYDYGVIYGDRYLLLKTSYVEALRKLCPGVVLRWKVIKDLCLHGVKEHDFLGEAEPYKMAWTNDVRNHASIVLYNSGMYSGVVHSLGRVVRWARRVAHPKNHDSDEKVTT